MCSSITLEALTFESRLPAEDADWKDVVRRITTDTEFGDMLEDWILHDGLLENGSLVSQSRFVPGDMASSEEFWLKGTSGPTLTLKQKNGLIKEIPW